MGGFITCVWVITCEENLACERHTSRLHLETQATFFQDLIWYWYRFDFRSLFETIPIFEKNWVHDMKSNTNQSGDINMQSNMGHLNISILYQIWWCDLITSKTITISYQIVIMLFSVTFDWCNIIKMVSETCQAQIKFDISLGIQNRIKFD